MPTRAAPRRDFHALGQRRHQAARLFAMGEVQAAVARALRVSRQSVSRWYDEWRRGGAGALRGAGRAGRKPRLSEAQLARVDVAWREGAQAHGYATDMWTLPRVATVIARLTGVQYHPGHVWRILRALDWSLQRPSTRARERNDAQIQHWVTTRWPAVKKTPDAGAPGFSSTTRAASRSARRSAGRGPRAARRPS